MSTPFDADQGLIVISAQVHGPHGITYARLALDTGVIVTTISTELLEAVGYKPVQATDFTRIVTASGIETVPRLILDQLEVLEQTRRNMLVISHAVPAATGVNGVLGLDFLRGQELTIDFRQGWLSLR